MRRTVPLVVLVFLGSSLAIAGHPVVSARAQEAVDGTSVLGYASAYDMELDSGFLLALQADGANRIKVPKDIFPLSVDVLGSRLAFSSSVGAALERRPGPIYVLDVPSNDLQELVVPAESEEVAAPLWLPDGRIAYSRHSPHGGPIIEVIGTSPENRAVESFTLPQHAIAAPAGCDTWGTPWVAPSSVSPDGTALAATIYFPCRHDVASDTLVVPLAPGGPGRVRRIDLGMLEGSPTWTDERRLMASVDGSVVTVDASGDAASRRALAPGHGHAFEPSEDDVSRRARLGTTQPNVPSVGQPGRIVVRNGETGEELAKAELPPGDQPGRAWWLSDDRLAALVSRADGTGVVALDPDGVTHDIFFEPMVSVMDIAEVNR